MYTCFVIGNKFNQVLKLFNKLSLEFNQKQICEDKDELGLFDPEQWSLS